METKKKILEHELEDGIYTVFNSGRKRLIIAGSILFFLGIVLNFPLKKTVNSFLATTLKPPKSCPFSYKDMSVEFFLPKLVFKDLFIPGSCYKKPKGGFNLENAKIYIKGPSFSPLGLSTKVVTQYEGQDLVVHAAVAPKKQKVKIPSTTIDAGMLNALFQNKFNLAGSLTTEVLAELQRGKLLEGNLLLTSKNLIIPSQNIQGFQLETMKLNTLLAKASVGKNGQLKVHELKVGDKKAPIILDLKGRINLILSAPAFSQVSLDGTLKVSKAFIDKMPLINAVLGGLKKEGDAYLVKISGTLAKPKLL